MVGERTASPCVSRALPDRPADQTPGLMTLLQTQHPQHALVQVQLLHCAKLCLGLAPERGEA